MLFKFIQDKGPREYMEDTHTYAKTDKYEMLAIFDGHGGGNVARFCSENIQGVIDNAIASETCAEMDVLMYKSFKNLHDEATKRFPPTIGSTATVCLIFNDKVVCGNCGDSSAIIGYTDKCKSLTNDHKVSDETDRLRALGANITQQPFDTPRINGSLNLSRSIGDSHLKPFVVPNPFVSIVKKHRDMKYVLLASDGLWDVVDQEYVHKFIMVNVLSFPFVTEAILDRALRLLLNTSRERGSTDNITICIGIIDQ
jgi:serine/threonine protein phosphatase PrpC